MAVVVFEIGPSFSQVRSALDERPYLAKTGVWIINNNTSAPEITQFYSDQVISRSYAQSHVWNLVDTAHERYLRSGKMIARNGKESDRFDAEQAQARLRAQLMQCVDCAPLRSRELESLIKKEEDQESRLKAEIRKMDQEFAAATKNEGSREELKKLAFKKLRNMLQSQDAVDIYIFSHTNSYHEELKEIPAELRKKIRFGYSAGCENAAQAPEYLQLGIGAYVAHPGASYSWLFIGGFQDAWKRGHNLAQSIDSGNHLSLQRIRGLVGKTLIDTATEEKAEKAYRGTKAQVFGASGLTVHSRYRSGLK